MRYALIANLLFTAIAWRAEKYWYFTRQPAVDGRMGDPFQASLATRGSVCFTSCEGVTLSSQWPEGVWAAEPGNPWNQSAMFSVSPDAADGDSAARRCSGGKASCY